LTISVLSNIQECAHIWHHSFFLLKRYSPTHLSKLYPKTVTNGLAGSKRFDTSLIHSAKDYQPRISIPKQILIHS